MVAGHSLPEETRQGTGRGCTAMSPGRARVHVAPPSNASRAKPAEPGLVAPARPAPRGEQHSPSTSMPSKPGGTEAECEVGREREEEEEEEEEEEPAAYLVCWPEASQRMWRRQHSFGSSPQAVIGYYYVSTLSEGAVALIWPPLATCNSTCLRPHKSTLLCQTKENRRVPDQRCFSHAPSMIGAFTALWWLWKQLARSNGLRRRQACAWPPGSGWARRAPRGVVHASASGGGRRRAATTRPWAGAGRWRRPPRAEKMRRAPAAWC